MLLPQAYGANAENPVFVSSITIKEFTVSIILIMLVLESCFKVPSAGSSSGFPGMVSNPFLNQMFVLRS